MSHPHFHTKSSLQKPTDYYAILPIHNFFDKTKCLICLPIHRALHHHKEGISLAQKIFGYTVDTDGNYYNVEDIGKQHLEEDFGYVPTMRNWYIGIEEESWMYPLATNLKISSLLSKKLGGQKEDYTFLVEFFSSLTDDDVRSNYVLNSSWGIFTAEEIYGTTFHRISDKKEIPIRTVAEEILKIKYKIIPTPYLWIQSITIEKWMYTQAKSLSLETL